MNWEWNFTVFLSVFIFCVSIRPEVTEAKSDKIDQVIVFEQAEDVTLLCNPSLRDNLTLRSMVSDFEWVTDNDIPIYTNGKFSLFLFDLYADTSYIAIDNNPPGTLILRKAITMHNSTFKCTFSTPLANVSYTYFLQIKGRKSFSSKYYSQIELKNRGDRVVVPCANDRSAPLPTDIGYYWLLRKNMPNDRQEVEIISINRSIILKNNSKGFQVAEDRSLIIPSLTSTWRTSYECHTPVTAFIWSTTGNKNDENEFKDRPITNFKTHNISVDYGTRNLVLPCPSIHKNTNSSYQWLFSFGGYEESTLLFFNQERFEYSTRLLSNFYEINEDGSLVILAVKLRQYGEYTCQRNTGEKYVYNVYKEEKFINETILIKSDMSNITLPCPGDDPRDGYDNRVKWSLNLASVDFWGTFFFLDGEPIASHSSLHDKLPQNVKLADNKRSLIVSNLTSMNPVKDEYVCSFTYSNKIYRYVLTK